MPKQTTKTEAALDTVKPEERPSCQRTGPPYLLSCRVYAIDKMSEPVTQIIYLTINSAKDLTDPGSPAGGSWSDALDLLEQHNGFRRLYWGRSPEEMKKVQLHIGKL